MTSRDNILKKLRASQQPFTHVVPIAPEQHRNMVPMPDQSPLALQERFILEARALKCEVHTPADDEAAIETLLALLGSETRVMRWADTAIPLSGLVQALQQHGISDADSGDATVNTGITGVDSALAATGSLVLCSGAGRDRRVSLLPAQHIAIVRKNQILPDLEAWFAQEEKSDLQNFRQAANVVIISGPSKTADIAQELILGAHGPVRVQIILI